MSSPKWDIVNGVRYQKNVHQNDNPGVTIIRDEDEIRKLVEEFNDATTYSYPKEYFLVSSIIWPSK